MNSNRGSAALALAAVAFRDPESAKSIRDVVRGMVGDASLAVRSCVAACLIAMLRYDRTWAVEQFLRLVDTREELLGTYYVERFLYHSILTDYDHLEGVIDRMVASTNDDVALAGSRQGCLASLEVEAARRVRDRCIDGRNALRMGAAEIFAANLRSAGHRDLCEGSLAKLFYDESPEVRKSAAHAFSTLQGRDLADFESLALAFIDSPAFEQEQEQLLWALDRCEVALPAATLRMAERFIEVAGPSVGDLSTRHAAHASDVGELVIRVYSQASEQLIRERALDALDEMTAMQAYGLDQALLAFERV